MSKLDEKKEEISKHKFYLGIIVVAIFGCTAWLVNSYKKCQLYWCFEILPRYLTLGDKALV